MIEGTNESNTKDEDITKDLKVFNWGAFFLTFIWGIRYKAWVTLLAIPLIWFQMPFFLNWILLTVLQIYCGIKGNEWAYKADKRQNKKDFQITQIKWAIAGVLVNIFIPFSIMLILARFIQKSPSNITDYIQNAQCTVSYNKLNKTLKYVPLLYSDTGKEIAYKFASKVKNSSLENDTVFISPNSLGKNEKLYQIVFDKKVNTVCSIEKKNCIIRSAYVVPADIYEFGECTFYFDNQKNIKPSEDTDKALKKGLNILKYL